MKNKVYAQVYSMIRTFPEGLIDALKYFSETGYDGVELIGNNTEGLSIPEFKALLDELNLKVAAVHGIGGAEDMEFAKALGVSYISTDIHPKTRTREEILGFCEELNNLGKKCREHGLKPVLHNHADEFGWIAGEEGQTRIYDLLLSHTDPALLGFELDVGWAALTGADFIGYICGNPGRFPLIHVKECSRLAATPEDLEHFPRRIFHDGLQKDPLTGVPILTEEEKADLYETRNWNTGLGTGIINWRALVDAADAQGCSAYISEREYYHYPGSNGTAACCVKLDYDFLRGL